MGRLGYWFTVCFEPVLWLLEQPSDAGVADQHIDSSQVRLQMMRVQLPAQNPQSDQGNNNFAIK